MSLKKDKERAIFDFVYANRTFDSVIPTEAPDFRVKNAHGEFGVEITEFYFSESEARMKNIPGYVEEILDRKTYRHKDDVVPLEVKELTVLPNDNRSPSFKVEGLVRQLPSIGEYVQRIAQLIIRKNKRFVHYVSELNHVNLIILDEERLLVGTPNEGFHHLFFQPELEKALVKADFREVFFITELGEYNAAKTVYVPLKMVFLVAEIFFLNYLLGKDHPDMLITPQLYAEFLQCQGARGIYWKDASDGFEVMYGNTGIFLTIDGSIKIRDYADFAIPGDFTPMTSSRDASFFDDAFVSSFEKYKRECIFRSSLCFEVGGTASNAR